MSEQEVSLSIVEGSESITLNLTEVSSPRIRSGVTGLEVSADSGLTWVSLVEYQEIVESAQIVVSEREVYIHEQFAAAPIWTINHNLDRFPSITIVDSAGTIVVGAGEYTDSNQIILTFSASFAGKAFLN